MTKDTKNPRRATDGGRRLLLRLQPVTWYVEFPLAEFIDDLEPDLQELARNAGLGHFPELTALIMDEVSNQALYKLLASAINRMVTKWFHSGPGRKLVIQALTDRLQGKWIPPVV